MSMEKIAITLDAGLLKKIDFLVKKKVFPNRSRVIQEAVRDKILKLDKGRLARECAKLEPEFEQAMADDGLTTEVELWPEY